MKNITYAIFADLEINASLKVIITNESIIPTPSPTFEPVWYYSNKMLWNITQYANDEQVYTAVSDERNYADFEVQNGPGAAKIDFYENSVDSITETITFTW